MRPLDPGVSVPRMGDGGCLPRPWLWYVSWHPPGPRGAQHTFAKQKPDGEGSAAGPGNSTGRRGWVKAPEEEDQPRCCCRLLAQGVAGLGSRDEGNTGAGEGRQEEPPSTHPWEGASHRRDLRLPAPWAPGASSRAAGSAFLGGTHIQEGSSVSPPGVLTQSLCATPNAAVRFHTFYWGAQFKPDAHRQPQRR